MSYPAKIIRVKNGLRIAVKMSYHESVAEGIRKVEGVIWDPARQAWVMPDTPANRERFGLEPLKVLCEGHAAKLRHFEDWMRVRRLSESTITTYVEAVRNFLYFFNGREVEDLDEHDLMRFNTDYVLARRLSGSYQTQLISGIKKFFETVERRRLQPELIYRPKREKVLPNVLSREEVRRLLESPVNLKHRAMLSMIYACGLRSGELLKLRPSDIHSDRQLVIIRQAKGKKDRMVPLSVRILEMLRDYYKAYRPTVFLFEGQVKGEAYDERSLQNVMKNAVKKAGIHKPATLHWLRHSYATHLLESGTDIRFIKELLGHESLLTTMRYTHVSLRNITQIRSPLDDLDL